MKTLVLIQDPELAMSLFADRVSPPREGPSRPHRRVHHAQGDGGLRGEDDFDYYIYFNFKCNTYNDVMLIFNIQRKLNRCFTVVLLSIIIPE